MFSPKETSPVWRFCRPNNGPPARGHLEAGRKDLHTMVDTCIKLIRARRKRQDRNRLLRDLFHDFCEAF